MRSQSILSHPSGLCVKGNALTHLMHTFQSEFQWKTRLFTRNAFTQMKSTAKEWSEWAPIAGAEHWDLGYANLCNSSKFMTTSFSELVRYTLLYAPYILSLFAHHISSWIERLWFNQITGFHRVSLLINNIYVYWLRLRNRGFRCWLLYLEKLKH